MFKIGDRVYTKAHNKNTACYAGKIEEISYGTKTIFHVMFDNLSWAWLYESELSRLTILCA
jgi:hypothetical protein